jgi:hypothetical protein
MAKLTKPIRFLLFIFLCAVPLGANAQGNGTLIIDTGSLYMGPSDTIDLGDYDALIRNNQLTDVISWIHSAMHGKDTHGVTKWDGPGITSSDIRAANVAAGFDKWSLGAVLNGDYTKMGFNSPKTVFDDASVDAFSTMIMYTRNGDANLDGVVNNTDYQYWYKGSHPPTGGTGVKGWLNGDFNYDGATNALDLAIWQANSVPEPGAFTLIFALTICSLVFVFRLKLKNILGLLSCIIVLAVPVIAHAQMPDPNLYLDVNYVNMGPNDLLELDHYDMIIRTNQINDVSSWIHYGMNGKDVNGITTWDGTHGIVSSAARAANVVAGFDKWSLGAVLNGDYTKMGAAPKTYFDGEPVDAYSTMVKYTLNGDINLDGNVTIADYNLWKKGAAGGTGCSGWINGDFNYDGVTNNIDLAVLQHYGFGVPEPATWALALVSFLVLLPYSRRVLRQRGGSEAI